MINKADRDRLRGRHAPLEMTSEEFRKVGYQVVDEIARWLDSLPQLPVTTGETPKTINAILGNRRMPNTGTEPAQLFEETTSLLFEHSLFNGHSRFWGYITSSAAPIGALGDLLAAAVNPNVGAWALAPMATAIEAQTIHWIADLIGYPQSCGGLMVSGGNMANFIGFLTARSARVPWNIREEGLGAAHRQLVVYGSEATHTWIQKATDLFGLGTNAMRWIDTDANQQIDLGILERQILSDRKAGYLPFLVVGAAGTVGTGVVDNLPGIAKICRQHNLWFHVDGAYGGFAATLPEASSQLKGLAQADSIALDPHKWLYSPIEAGCVLVREPKSMMDTFSFHPEYYNFDVDEESLSPNYYEFGPQNSRGFRALKVWLGLRQVGREGYIKMIRDDISLAESLHDLIASYEELEAITQNLSITTFRYIPVDLIHRASETETYLNKLNQEILNQLQVGGEVFISNATVEGKYVLRACIVNFRTTMDDIAAVPEIVIRIGRKVDADLRPITDVD